MKQSRIMSLAESFANVVVGHGVAVATQIVVFPLFGLSTTLAENMVMGAIFTVVSIARSYTLRHFFEAIQIGIAAGGYRVVRHDWKGHSRQ